MRRLRRPTAALLQFPHLIRFRLTIWYTGLAAIVLAAFVGGVSYEFSQYQFSSYNDEVASILQKTFQEQVKIYYPPAGYGGHAIHRSAIDANPVFGLSLTDPTALSKDGANIRFYNLEGQPLTTVNSTGGSKLPAKAPLNGADAARAVATTAHSGTEVTTDCGKWRCITLPLYTTEGGEVIGQIAAPMTHIEQQVQDLRRILIYTAGVLLIISAAGGWLLAGRALKPIDEITRRAQQITIHDLSQRLDLAQEDELGRMAATFDDLIERLQDAFERQKRFTSDASHELRTPLTVMQADLGLALTRPRSAEEYRQTLVSMDEEVTRLSSIVNDLLMLTRLDVDPAGMQHQPVALHELLQSLVNRVRVIAAERNITVAADALGVATVVGDATRLRQLFTNLLDNAVTYTPTGGRVSVAVERTREGVRVQVSDTGIGIAPEHMAHIFDRFYRTSEAREQNPHGTGLGLAISRSVVQTHHGDITVHSTPGEGTTFTVLLPADGRRRVRRAHSLRSLLPTPSAVASR